MRILKRNWKVEKKRKSRQQEKRNQPHSQGLSSSRPGTRLIPLLLLPRFSFLFCLGCVHSCDKSSFFFVLLFFMHPMFFKPLRLVLLTNRFSTEMKALLPDNIFRTSGFAADGPFAASGHMVQNPPCWRASCPLGHPEQSDFIKTNLHFLCFGCPSA